MVGVSHGGLALAADALTRGTIDHIVGTPIPLGVEMGTIEEIFEVGPTHHMIGHLHGNTPIGAFEFHQITYKSDAIGRDRALWRANAKKQRSLHVLPTHKGFAPPEVGAKEQRERIRATGSTLFYARNLRWTSQALLAASTAQPTLGGRAWTALKHEDPRVRKAFALWWNSIFGMIVHWTQGQRTQSGRSTTQIGALRKIPCPRLDRLSDSALGLATARFDALSDRSLLPAKDAAVDSVRHEIDSAVSEMFEIHKEGMLLQRVPDSDSIPESEIRSVTAILREIWCAEPSVHGRKRTITNE